MRERLETMDSSRTGPLYRRCLSVRQFGINHQFEGGVGQSASLRRPSITTPGENRHRECRDCSPGEAQNLVSERVRVGRRQLR